MVFGKLHRELGAAASTWPGMIRLGCIEDFCLNRENTEKIRGFLQLNQMV
jgi:hypothetical protein